MITKTELRWSYVPADLFEPDTQVLTSVGNWTFGDGFAHLQLPAPLDPVPSNLIDARTEVVEQMLSARAFDVGRSTQIVGHANTYHHSAAGVSQVIVSIPINRNGGRPLN
jgi:hypothetical protein